MPAPVAPPRALQKPQPASLMIEDPVRSGQSVVFMEGDITVIGSVGSGAEIIAVGSIYVYRALCGRAGGCYRQCPGADLLPQRPGNWVRFVDRVFPALAQQKNLRMEKPWIECEWRDRGNRYPINALVPMINQRVAIGRADDGHDN